MKAASMIIKCRVLQHFWYMLNSFVLILLFIDYIYNNRIYNDDDDEMNVILAFISTTTRCRSSICY